MLLVLISDELAIVVNVTADKVLDDVGGVSAMDKKKNNIIMKTVDSIHAYHFL